MIIDNKNIFITIKGALPRADGYEGHRDSPARWVVFNIGLKIQVSNQDMLKLETENTAKKKYWPKFAEKWADLCWIYI